MTRPTSDLTAGAAVLAGLLACGAPAPAAGVSFERAVIDARPPNNPWVKVVADLNGDGKPDVIIGGAKGPLVWYANPGWKKSVIAEGGYESVDGEAADVDGDGDLDLILGGIVWYENPRPKGDPAKDPWRARRIGRHRTHDVEVADLDGDGKPDVVVRGQTGFGHREGHRFFVWKQHAPDRWSSREVRCPEGEGLKLADIDGDGDPDVVTAGRWYENRGDILKGEWAEHVYAPEWKQGDCKVEAGDFNGDGRADVVLSPAEFKGGRHRIAWFEAPADRKRGRWREHVIEPAVESVVHALGVADLNGDGAADVVTARMHQGDPPQEVSVYLNGDSGRKWAKHVISTKGSHNIVLADLDGDGRTDILGANHGGPHQPAEWWRNSTRGEPGADPVFDLPDGFAQQVVAAGLTGATGMAVAPDGRVFVCEQTGALRVVKGGRLLPEPFLKLEVDSYWERGLIGVALDPDFAKNGYVYVCYVAAEPHPHHRVSRFTAAGDKAVPGSEVLLLRGDDQTKLGGSVPAGHQGGGMHFGPDGKLYVAVGEQTAGAPAQRLDTFQGKLLRINPDGSIPEDNPFFRKAKGKYRAIWALGLRNPFGFAFQPGTGRMLINDVGGSRWEEINEGAPGANYGWPASEGPTTRPGHRSPLYAYGEGNKKSIAGGVFYDPPRRQFPEKYLGKYFFAEYMQGWVGVLDPDGGKLVEKFATGLPGPVALALAADGSLYVLNRDAWVKDDAFRPGTGTLHRVFYVQGSGRPGPVVTTPPRDATTVAGGEATFRVEATGPGPLRYRWQKNGRRIDGADAATLTVARAAAGDDGAAFQCVITGPHGTVKTRPARLWVTRLREPVEPGPLAAGLHYEAHAGSWPALPPFEPATRVKAGVAPGFDVGLRPRGEHFGLVFTGFLDVDRDGAYTFRLGASGAAKLFVAGAEVASLGMANGPRSASGTVGLRAGKHPIRLHFAHGGGRPLLEVRCSGPGLAEQPIPAAKLFRPERAGAGSARARPLAVTLNVPARPEDLPPLLSQTGIFCSLEDLTPQAGVVPYDVNTPLWSDGALKRRWIALPGDERIGFAGHGAWKFPAGTVLIKHFEFGDEQAPPGKRRRLETRLLVVDRTGLGYGVTYRWRDDQRDAELLPDGLTEDVTFATPSGERARRWTYPSRGECLVCHTPQAGFVLGVNTRQLNRPFPDPGSGKSENQLRAWSRAGMFDRELPEAAVAGFPRLAALDDVTASLEHRARSYLDANCAQCHRPGGARGDFDLRFEIPLARQRLIGGKLESADLGIAGAAVVVPGDRSRSMIYQRMSRRRDVFNMPPLATHEVDAEACEVIGRWIDSLTGTSAPTGKSPRPKKPKTPEPLGAALAPSRFVSGSLR